MDDPNRQILEAVATVLVPVLDEVVFVGGCVTGLLITDPAAEKVQPTTDVDVITEVSSYGEYADLSERLRDLGLVEDNSEDSPTCRWRYEALVIDVMPTDEKILGFAGQWYRPAIASAQRVQLGDIELRIIKPEYFVATKIEAFRGRGMGDYLATHDLEDLMAVVNGRPELTDEMSNASPDVQNYVGAEFRELLDTPAFLEAVPGHLSPDDASQARAPLLRERLERIASLT